MTRKVQDPELYFTRHAISLACLDYIALSFPEVCQTYINRWWRRQYGNGGDRQSWIRQQRDELEQFLAGNGGKMADLVEMDTYITRVRQLTKSKRGRIMAEQIEHGQYTFGKRRESA